MDGRVRSAVWLADSGPMSQEQLDGEVAGVVFDNPESGFAVLELAGPGDADGARAAGLLSGLVAGQPVRLHGRWTDHPRYGPTFRVDSYEAAQPRTARALVAFLASPRFPGVGDVTARRLVDTFGDRLPEVIEGSPEELARVQGVSAELARTIARGWAEAGALGELTRRLAAAGLSATAAEAVHRRFGAEALELCDTDPYQLGVVRGVGWNHVDALGRAAGIDPGDPRRLAAAAVTAVAGITWDDGHTWAPTPRALAAVRRLLRADDATAEAALQLAESEERLVCEPVQGEPGWYLPGLLDAEQGLADELARLLAAPSRLAGRDWQVSDPELVEAQQAAVLAALSVPVSVLTGGPGTGKTRALRALVATARNGALQVALCAPTGRAAKRLEEVCGHAATTVHRLLDARPDPSSDEPGTFRFSYDAERRLPHDLVVVDEASMADVTLAWSLTQAVDDGSHLAWVGDADQLPSVGPGAVLRDLLQAGTRAPLAVHRLTEVHRQAARSRIVTLAHELNRGVAVAPRGRDGDVFAVPERSEAIPARVAEIVAVRAPDFFGCSPADVQVLAPMYRGPAGVDALNAALKARLNPPGDRPALRGLHEGDRVVATRNDAELDVANGDVGEVTAVDTRERTVAVAFAQGVAEFPFERAADLAHAWCLTVHKAQGAEWPVVVLVLDPGHRRMLWRELVYTGVTRAERGLLIVGEPGLLAEAATRVGTAASPRRTGLAARIVRATTQFSHDGGAPIHT